MTHVDSAQIPAAQHLLTEYVVAARTGTSELGESWLRRAHSLRGLHAGTFGEARFHRWERLVELEAPAPIAISAWRIATHSTAAHLSDIVRQAGGADVRVAMPYSELNGRARSQFVDSGEILVPFDEPLTDIRAIDLVLELEAWEQRGRTTLQERVAEQRLPLLISRVETDVKALPGWTLVETADSIAGTFDALAAMRDELDAATE